MNTLLVACVEGPVINIILTFFFYRSQRDVERSDACSDDDNDDDDDDDDNDNDGNPKLS